MLRFYVTLVMHSHQTSHKIKTKSKFDLSPIFVSFTVQGLAVAQLCKLVGDVTLFGVASKAKHETLEPLGLITNLLERNGDYLNEVRK